MKRANLKRFAPAWVRPIGRESLLRSDTENQKYAEAETARVAAETLAIELPRLGRLMDYYGIEQSGGSDVRWMHLVILLARDFVPGFAVKMGGKRPGRPIDPNGFALIFEIEAIAAAQSISIGKACETLCKQNRTPWKGRDVRSIEADYYKRKRALGKSDGFAALYSLWRALLKQNPPVGSEMVPEIMQLMTIAAADRTSGPG